MLYWGGSGNDAIQKYQRTMVSSFNYGFLGGAKLISPMNSTAMILRTGPKLLDSTPTGG